MKFEITLKFNSIALCCKTSFGSESTVGNLGKTIASINAGSDDGTIFGEGLPSDVEEQIALLQAELGPVVIDCKKNEFDFIR